MRSELCKPGPWSSDLSIWSGQVGHLQASTLSYLPYYFICPFFNNFIINTLHFFYFSWGDQDKVWKSELKIWKIKDIATHFFPVVRKTFICNQSHFSWIFGKCRMFGEWRIDDTTRTDSSSVTHITPTWNRDTLNHNSTLTHHQTLTQWYMAATNTQKHTLLYCNLLLFWYWFK